MAKSTRTWDVYSALGHFVVRFEHVMYALRHRISLLCGYSDELEIILDPFSARQSVDLLEKLVAARLAKVTLIAEDVLLFKSLISDLNTYVSDRNRIVHSVWFLTSGQENTDIFTGVVGIRPNAAKKGTVRGLDSKEFELFRKKSEGLYLVLFALWPIERSLERCGPPLSVLFERESDGVWKRRPIP